MNFFPFNFALCEYIFWYFARPHPRYKFSNGPSLNLPFSEWSRITDPVPDHPLGSPQRNAPQKSLINYYLPSSCLPFSSFFRNNVIAIRCKSWCSFYYLKIRIHSHHLYVGLCTSHRFKKKVWHALKLFQFQFSFNVFFLPEKNTYAYRHSIYYKNVI